MNGTGVETKSDLGNELTNETNSQNVNNSLTDGELLDAEVPGFESLLAQLTSLPKTDSLVALLFLMAHQAGFYCQDGPHNTTHQFNIQLMKELLNDKKYILKKIISDEKNTYNIIFTHNLLQPKTFHMVAYKISLESKDQPELLIVNFLLENDQSFQLTVDCKQYFSIQQNKLIPLNGEIKKLSIIFKNYLYNILCTLSDDYYPKNHILNLPLHILQKLCKYLTFKDFVNLQFASRLVYIEFKDDETLWKYYTKVHFSNLHTMNDLSWKGFFEYAYKREMKSSCVRFWCDYDDTEWLST